MKKVGKGQKISFFVAIISYIAAIASVAGTFYSRSELGGDHPITASFGAAVVFFIGVGIVLHVIGRVDIPDLSMKFPSNKPDDRK